MQSVRRLINQFVPKNYNLSISINRTDRKFDGNIIITGKSSETSNEISFHSKDLEIKSVKIDGQITDFNFNDDLLTIKKQSNKTDNKIAIDFSGKITDAMHGIYPCYYEHDGVKKELIATQFESHHAREVFPCIDEPEAKATYDLKLKTETNVTVLGNMPIKSQSICKNKLTTIFETTPPMSSYLLAWVVGELHKKTAHTKSGVEINVWATLAQPEIDLEFGLDIATKTTDFFDEYFDTPYPLPKCDHVALPDFSSGAMENWGLITYRESTLLANPKSTSISTKHYVATVISHEISHQWFGNLVTMKWWDDLWLNESFASLIEYEAIDAIEPTWNIWLDFVSHESIYSLRRDSLKGVQPVQTGVNHPDEIGSLFDGAIVYIKGARLIQMLRVYIGEKAFRDGLKQYFKDFAYQNTIGNDLWDALNKSSGKDVKKIMNTWISQPGFPVLHATRNGKNIELTQNRLSSDKNDKSDTLWPITLNSNDEHIPKIMDTKSMIVTPSVKNAIRFNIGNHAHFITHYSKELMTAILNELNLGKLNPVDRLQLINEQTLLANAGIISSAELVELLKYCENEDNEVVWGMISQTISEIRKFAEDDEKIESKLKKLVNIIAKKQFERLGWVQKPNESDNDTKMRNIIIKLMIYSDDKNAINSAINIFDSNKLEDINAELRPIIISTKIRENGDKTIVKNLLEVYKSTSSPELGLDISIGLTATKNPAIIAELLETMKDSSTVRRQDVARWFVYLLRNKYAKDISWQWVRSNWNWIKDNFSGDKSYDDYPRLSATALSTRNELNEYRDFFTPMISIPALSRVISIGINEIENRVKSIERDKESVTKALLDL